MSVGTLKKAFHSRLTHTHKHTYTVFDYDVTIRPHFLSVFIVSLPMIRSRRRIGSTTVSHHVSRPIMIKIDDDYDEERKNSMRTTSTTTTTTTTRRRRRRRGEETTIPSVVAFVPDSDNYKDHKPLPPSQLSDDDASRSCRLQNNMESFLPPIWATMTRTRSAASTPSSLSCQDSNPSVHWPTNRNYQILVGNPAIQYESQFPNSTYRNVKRIIGTGGKVAKMAFGVVPNLFVHDDNQNHENADVLLSPKGNNRTQPNKRSKKLRRRKELEGLPKLRKSIAKSA